jgi:hypothetical protein
MAPRAAVDNLDIESPLAYVDGLPAGSARNIEQAS